MVAVAGAISMAASTFSAVSGAADVEEIEADKRVFLGQETKADAVENPTASAITVGCAYLLGAAMPIVPILFGAHTFFFSLGVSLLLAGLLSAFVAFFSGLPVQKRVLTSVVSIVVAASMAAFLGLVVRELFGIS